MKSIKYIISISIALLYGTSFRSTACSYDVYSPSELNIFRLCDPEMLEQWHKGKRFQEDEKLQNCRLWQKATSPQIKTDEIQQVVYKSSLIQLRLRSLPEPFCPMAVCPPTQSRSRFPLIGQGSRRDSSIYERPVVLCLRWR